MTLLDSILSLLASYLAGNLPTVKGLFGLDKRIGLCFWKARMNLNEADADRYKGKRKQLNANLIEFIKGNKPKDEKLERMLGLWVAEIKKEKDGFGFILEKKIEGLDSKVVGLSDEVKARIDSVVPSLEKWFKTVGEKVDSVGKKIDGVEEKVDLVGEKVDGVGELVGEVRDLVAESDTKIDRILKKLNKPHLICLNDRLLKSHTLPGGEINARRLTDGSFWSDEACIGMAIEGLKHHPYFVIKGAEGRGKSILSYQVALDLIINEDYMVFVTDKSWSWQEIYKELDVLMEGDEQVLVLLENIHQAENDLSNIYNYTKDHRGNGNHLFLMNRRPIDGNASGSENGEEVGCLLDLDDIQEIRARKTAEYLADPERTGLNIDELTVDGDELRSNLPPNLRVLSRYFQIFKEKGVTNVSEANILDLFDERFKLNNADMGLLECLMMLGAINIFDVPLDTAALRKEERDILKKFLSDKDSKGLYYKQGAKLFLPHSSDAAFLCKAICRRDLRPNEELGELYVGSVTDTVIAYYDALIIQFKTGGLRKSVLEDISQDFLSFMSSLVKMEEFGALLEYFREPEKAKVIIKTICPRFVIGALAGNDNSLERLSIYKESIPFIKSNLSRYNFVFFSHLYLVLRHYEGYEDDQLVKDFFTDDNEEELKELLLKHNHITKGQFFYKIKDKDFFESALNDIRQIRHGFVKNTHPKKHPEGISRIQSELTVVTRYLKEGEVTIQDVQGKIEALIQEIKDRIVSAPDENPTHVFSYIFRDLGFIDSMTDASFKKFKPDLMKDEIILADARKRLANFNFSREQFYYFSHFYNDDYQDIRDGLRTKISSVTSFTDQWSMERMIYWICFVRNAYKPENLDLESFDENSLASDVEKFVRADAKMRLKNFHYNLKDFRYFSYFYNGAYSGIRDSVDRLITNVKYEWQRMRMSDWIDSLEKKHPPKSFPMALADAVREQLGRPASSQGESEDE